MVSETELKTFVQMDTMLASEEKADDIVEQLGYEMFRLRDGRVIIDGYVVPHLLVNVITDETYPYWVQVGQINYPVKDKSALCQVISVAAHISALTAGFTSFGRDLRPQDARFNTAPHGLMTPYRIHQFTQLHGDPFAVVE